MAYVKTAKDIAWDKERNKLKSEISSWIQKCGEKEHTIQCQIGQIEILKNRIADLEEAITTITDGKMTPDEAVMKIRKNAELADMVKFLFENGGGIYHASCKDLLCVED